MERPEIEKLWRRYFQSENDAQEIAYIAVINPPAGGYLPSKWKTLKEDIERINTNEKEKGIFIHRGEVLSNIKAPFDDRCPGQSSGTYKKRPLDPPSGRGFFVVPENLFWLISDERFGGAYDGSSSPQCLQHLNGELKRIRRGFVVQMVPRELNSDWHFLFNASLRVPIVVLNYAGSLDSSVETADGGSQEIRCLSIPVNNGLKGILGHGKDNELYQLESLFWYYMLLRDRIIPPVGLAQSRYYDGDLTRVNCFRPLSLVERLYIWSPHKAYKQLRSLMLGFRDNHINYIGLPSKHMVLELTEEVRKLNENLTGIKDKSGETYNITWWGEAKKQWKDAKLMTLEAEQDGHLKFKSVRRRRLHLNLLRHWSRHSERITDGPNGPDICAPDIDDANTRAYLYSVYFEFIIGGLLRPLIAYKGRTVDQSQIEIVFQKTSHPNAGGPNASPVSLQTADPLATDTELLM